MYEGSNYEAPKRLAKSRTCYLVLQHVKETGALDCVASVHSNTAKAQHWIEYSGDRRFDYSIKKEIVS
jgi:hypothetical protein